MLISDIWRITSLPSFCSNVILPVFPSSPDKNTYFSTPYLSSTALFSPKRYLLKNACSFFIDLCCLSPLGSKLHNETYFFDQLVLRNRAWFLTSINKLLSKWVNGYILTLLHSPLANLMYSGVRCKIQY
jgi:hypothetical protein